MLTEQKFTTEITSPTIAGLGKLFGVSDKVDVDTTYEPIVKVEWNFYIEVRDYGIKDISAVATRLTSSIEWTVPTEELSEEDKVKLIAAGGVESTRNETIDGVYEFDSDNNIGDKAWKIDSDISTGNGSIYPDDCGIDFNDMSIYVN